MADAVRNEGYVTVDNNKIGLDRANIKPHDRIELPRKSEVGIDIGAVEQRDSDSSKRERLREKKDHAKDKLKRVMHIHNEKDSGQDAGHHGPVLAPAVDKPSDSRLVHDLQKPEKTTMNDLVHNPIDTVKNKVSGQGSHQAAANIAAKEISHGEEVDLVRAHDRLDNAENETERLLAVQDLDALMKERQNMFVRWTMDRHVTKVRRLPKHSFAKRSAADFEKIDPVEGRVMDWRGYLQHLLEYYSQQYGGQYIGYGSDPPKPSKESIMPNVERLLIASSPMQEFIMTVRRVYRWEAPLETTKYLAIYLTLWYFNLILPGALSFFVYLVAERRVHGRIIDDVREDIKRTEDTSRTALSINELIEKRGDEHWADELLEGLGPWLMVQLADGANALEVMRNFYEWRKPYRTASTLAILVLGVMATALTPLWLLVKASTFAAGFAFFALWPIAVNLPEYRLLVSPVKHIFWSIPTHAEWSIKVLQAKSARYYDKHADRSDSDIGAYKAHYKHTTGRLILSHACLRFVSKAGHNEHFGLLYSQLNNLEKVDRIVSKNLPKPEPIRDSGKDLKFVDVQGNEYIVSNLDGRDEAFSQIVGFSDIDWQVVW